jgi:uncharacterized protein YxjI
MRYQIVQDKLFGKGMFSITDDSGAVRFEVSGRRSLCDPQGAELLAIRRHPLGRQVDIVGSGQLVASVHVKGLGMAEDYNVDGPSGQLSAAGDFGGRNYTLTVPSGSVIAMVSAQPGFRERFNAETAAGQDDVLLLAVILAIEELRDSKRKRGIT